MALDEGPKTRNKNKGCWILSELNCENTSSKHDEIFGAKICCAVPL